MEAALLLPVMFLLLIGMVEIARVTYTYYTIQKILTTLARMAGTQQGVNFCDAGDATVAQMINFALTGASDTSTAPIVPNLVADQIRIRIERVDPSTGDVGECECSATGCDAGTGGRAPDFIVVSLTDGYPLRLAVPFVQLEPFLLRPQVRLPYGGT